MGKTAFKKAIGGRVILELQASVTVRITRARVRQLIAALDPVICIARLYQFGAGTRGHAISSPTVAEIEAALQCTVMARNYREVVFVMLYEHAMDLLRAIRAEPLAYLFARRERPADPPFKSGNGSQPVGTI